MQLVFPEVTPEEAALKLTIAEYLTPNEVSIQGVGITPDIELDHKLSPEYGQLADWRYYDLVTEVNDDVEDLYEDLDFINGNRFLISILHNGKQKTKVIFDQFLQIIEDKSIEKYQNTQGKMKEEIYVQTRHQISETRNLLDLRLESVSIESLHRSELAKYMISKDIVI